MKNNVYLKILVNNTNHSFTIKCLATEAINYQKGDIICSVENIGLNRGDYKYV